ncbi:hypothetical protein [Blastococcus sp. SYSU DS0533]
MTGVQREVGFLAPGEPVDLTNCEREPIHVPGTIQPRGVLIAVRDPDWIVQQVSENLADLTGVHRRHALGRPLAEVIGVAPADAVIRSASCCAATSCGGSAPATTTTAPTRRPTPPVPRPSSSGPRCRCGWSTGRRRRSSTGRCARGPRWRG